MGRRGKGGGVPKLAADEFSAAAENGKHAPGNNLIAAISRDTPVVFV